MTKQKKIKRIIRKNVRWIICIVSVILLAYLIQLIFSKEQNYFDEVVYNFIAKTISDPVTILMKCITTMGSALVLIFITFVIFCTTNKTYGRYVTINLILITILNVLFKNIFDRPRPEEFRLIEEVGNSFPSGHSMVSMAFYGLIIYFLWKKIKKPYIKWTLCVSLVLLVVGIGISRIYLGVHYASDVLAGFCFSIAYLACFTQFLRSIREESEQKWKK